MTNFVDRYSRLVKDLSKNDILAIAFRYKIETTTVDTREKIIADISFKNNNILRDDHRFYFGVDNENNLYNVDMLKILDFSLFPDRKSSGRKIDFDKIKEFLPKQFDSNASVRTLESNFSKPVGKSDQNQLSSPPPSGPEHTTTQSSELPEKVTEIFQKLMDKTKEPKNFPKTSTPHNILGVKLKYEQSRGIDSFLSLIDTFSDTYNISDPAEKVKIALLALDNSDHGLTVKNYLSREDCQNWELFCSKLQSLLGRDADSYREEYETWTENTADPPTLSIAKLITAFKFSFEPPKDFLTLEDETRLIRKFIKSQEQPVKGYLLAEQKTLDLKSLGRRTSELRRAFGGKSSYNINHINHHSELVKTEDPDPESLEAIFSIAKKDILQESKKEFLDEFETLLETFIDKLKSDITTYNMN